MPGGIQNRNQVANQLSLAADEVKDVALRRRLRELTRKLMADRRADTDLKIDQEMIRLSAQLPDYVHQQQYAVVQMYMDRLENLMSRRGFPAQEGKKMGLFDKLKGMVEKKPRISAEEAAYAKTDEQLFELEKQVAIISEKRKREVEKLQNMIAQAAKLEAESFEYKQLRGRAGIVKSQIKLYENQINSYFHALMNSQRYVQLIENGQAMSGLSGLIPDPAEADVLLDQLAQKIEMAQDQQNAFGDVIGAHGKRVEAGMNSMEAEDGAFDQAVQAARSEAAEQQRQGQEQNDPAGEIPAADAGECRKTAQQAEEI